MHQYECVVLAVVAQEQRFRTIRRRKKWLRIDLGDCEAVLRDRKERKRSLEDF